MKLFSLVLIGCCDNSGFGLTTLNRKALCRRLSVGFFAIVGVVLWFVKSTWEGLHKLLAHKQAVIKLNHREFRYGNERSGEGNAINSDIELSFISFNRNSYNSLKTLTGKSQKLFFTAVYKSSKKIIVVFEQCFLSLNSSVCYLLQTIL